MPTPPESTKSSLALRLRAHAREHWPQLTELTVHFRGGFAYATAELPDGDELPLCRLRYPGSAATWGFALYLASSGRYEDQVLPTGSFAGTPEEALDCACGLYLAGPAT